MQVAVRVAPDVADALRDTRAADAAAAIREAAAAAGVDLVPQHPGVEDRVLSRWFGAPVADPEVAERLAEQLRELDGVEAAYVKPGELSGTSDAA